MPLLNPMRRLFLMAFGIRPNELAIANAFFALFAALGVAATLGTTAADTLFLSRHGVAEAEGLLPFIYVAIGGTAFGVASLFEPLRARVPRRVLFAVTLGALGASVVALRLWLPSGPRGLYFAAVVWMDVCCLLGLTLVFGHAADTFTGRDAKRLYGYITGGLAAGTIASGYSVDALVARVGAEGLLMVTGGAFGGAGAIGLWSFRLRRRLRLQQGGQGADEAPTSPAPLREVLGDRFLQLTFAFALAGLVCGVLGDYQLKIVASRSMDEQALAAFFGRFYAWLGLAQLVIQFGLVGLVLRRFGLLHALLLLPMLTVFTSSAFVLFPLVLVAAGGEFVRQGLSETLDQPSRELLFMPLSPSVRTRAQAFAGGPLEALGQVLAGGALLGAMQVLPDIRYVGVLSVAVAAGWLWAARRLRPRYEHTLATSLEGRRLATMKAAALLEGEDERETARGLLARGGADAALALEVLPAHTLTALMPELASLCRSPDEALALGALEVVRKSATPGAVGLLRAALEDRRDRVRAAALIALFERDPEQAAPLVRALAEGEGPELRGAALSIRLCDPDEAARAEARVALGRLAQGDEAARLAAAWALRRHREPPLLGALLMDPERRVRAAALGAAQAQPDLALLPELRARLDDPHDRPRALEALLALGPEAAAVLVELTSGREELLVRLSGARALGAMPEAARGSAEVRAALERRWLEVVDELSILCRARTQCPPAMRTDAALLQDHGRVLAQLLLALLCLSWPPEPIRRAEQRLFSGDPRLVSNALELLDSVLPRHLATRIVPALSALTAHGEDEAGGFTASTLQSLAGSGTAWVRALAAARREAA